MLLATRPSHAYAGFVELAVNDSSNRSTANQDSKERKNGKLLDNGINHTADVGEWIPVSPIYQRVISKSNIKTSVLFTSMEQYESMVYIFADVGCSSYLKG